MILRPTKTIVGRSATFNATNTGTNLTLTHISIGDKGGPIDDSVTKLRNERERAMCVGSRTGLDQIHLDSAFNGPNEYWVREVGVWAGDTLVYYWSTSGEELGYKSANFDWLIGLDLYLDPVGDGPINVTAAAPNLGLAVAPYMANILKSLADTNRLVLINNYLK